MLTAQDIDREFTEAIAYRLPRNRAMYDQRVTIHHQVSDSVFDSGSSFLYDEMLPDHLHAAILPGLSAWQYDRNVENAMVKEFPEGT